ncbi:MAG: hypothetical protein E6I08_04955 [Chloroflexi bacterium]|nr:MAG: hypothetical protein E6I08_04955 [Chloroflexota bacterium]
MKQLAKGFLLALLLLGSACSSTSAPAQTASPALSPSSAATPAGLPTAAASVPSGAPVIVSASSRYGQIVVDAGGRTLYLFDAEAGGSPRCYGACAAAWPPLLTSADPLAGAGLTSDLAGSVLRSDGARQVTYNGHPLYYYAGDRAPGEIRCQAAVEYGGGWYVLDSAGHEVSRP